MESFRYLAYTPDRQPEDCVRARYPDAAALGERCIIARVKHKTYEYFVAPNIATAAAHIAADSEQIYHEVIYEDCPQRLKFDIDASKTDIMALDMDDAVDALGNPLRETPKTFSDRCDEIINYIIGHILRCFAIAAGVEDQPKLLIYSSSTDKKLSYHIIIDGWFAEHAAQARLLATDLINILQEENMGVHSFIDKGVYKSTQNFRLLGQYKVGEDGQPGQSKQWVGGQWPEYAAAQPTLAQSFVRAVGALDFPIRNRAVANPATDRDRLMPEYELIRDICELNEDIARHHTFRCKVPGLAIYNFDSHNTQQVCTVCPPDGRRNYGYNYAALAPGDRPRLIRPPADIHAKDNFLFVRTETEIISDEQYTVHVFMCCRNTPGAKVHIGSRTIDVVADADRELIRAAVARGGDVDAPIAQRVLSCRERILASAAERSSADMPIRLSSTAAALPHRNIYNSPQLQEFELASTLIVKAAMKMGKTKKVIKYITGNFDESAVIRVISFRQTFSNSILADLKPLGFETYQNIVGQIGKDQRRVIVQVESLHRLAPQPGDLSPADLVLLDESESIIEQLNSPNHRGNFTANMAIFRHLIGRAKHVVCMDAYAGDRTLKVMRLLRPSMMSPLVAFDDGEAPVAVTSREETPDNMDLETVTYMPGGIYHYNTFKNQTADTYYVTADVRRWLKLIHFAVDAGEKIVICSNSLTQAKHIYRVLFEKLGFNPARIQLYSSESTQAERRHFDDVNAEWTKLDVLIYTPTITAGVSFEVAHFDRMFCYFSDQSCDVRTCVQMMGRIRNLASAEYYLCVEAYGDNLPTSAREVILYQNGERINLGRDWQHNLIDFAIGPNGDFVPNPSINNLIWAENCAVQNLSRNIFAQLLVSIVAEYGSAVEFLTDDKWAELVGMDDAPPADIEAELAEVEEQHDTAKKEEKAETIEALVAAPDITHEEALILESKVADRVDLTPEERPIWQRYLIRRRYNYWPVADDEYVYNDLSAKFVKTYGRPSIHRVFRNLQRVAMPQTDRGDKLLSPLKQIQDIEREKYITVMRDNPDADLAYKYVFEQHRFALHLARTIGINSIFAEIYIPRQYMYESLKNEMNNIRWGWNLVKQSMGVRVRRGEWEAINTNVGNINMFMPAMVKFVNKILQTMYGGKLVEVAVDDEDAVEDDGQPAEAEMYRFRPCNLFELRERPADGMIAEAISARPIIWV